MYFTCKLRIRSIDTVCFVSPKGGKINQYTWQHCKISTAKQLIYTHTMPTLRTLNHSPYTVDTKRHDDTDTSSVCSCRPMPLVRKFWAQRG